jgi:outer membrane protein
MGLVAGFSGVASAGDSPWTLKIGASQVAPKSNGGLANGVEISDEINLTPAIEYKFTDNIVGEVLLALPYEHDIDLNGAKVASFKHLPPTFTAKYLFSPNATISPYVGLGLNYTLTWGEDMPGADLDLGDSIGLAATVGAEYRMPNSPWGVALDVRYIKINADVEVNGNSFGSGSVDVDPTVVGLSAVYHY